MSGYGALTTIVATRRLRTDCMDGTQCRLLAA